VGSLKDGERVTRAPEIVTPAIAEAHPSAELLEWHGDVLFRA